jgi:signal transduction histidine kinase
MNAAPADLRPAASLLMALREPAALVWPSQGEPLFNEAYGLLRGSGAELPAALMDVVRKLFEGESPAEPKDWSTVPLRDEAGAVQGVLLVLHDSDTLGRAIGHDLRNPLAAMLSSAQLLERRGEDDPRIADPARRIVTSVGRLTHMLDQLLDYTLMRTQAVAHLKVGRVNAAQLVGSELETVRAAFPVWKVSFEALGDVECMLDAERIAKVVANLGANAALHASESPCRVRLDGRAADVVVMTFESDAPFAEGLSPFASFEAEGPRKGIGLGLYLARARVHAHGGTLTCDPADGRTRFTVTLPRQPRPMKAR